MVDSLEGYSYGALEQMLSGAGVNPVHAKPLFRLCNVDWSVKI